MNEDNKSTLDNSEELLKTSIPVKMDDGNKFVSSKDDTSIQSSPLPEPRRVKNNPLSPKWWSSKNESGQSVDSDKVEIVAVETTVTTQPQHFGKNNEVVVPAGVTTSLMDNQAEIKEPIVVVTSMDSQPEVKGSETTSLPSSGIISELSDGAKNIMATVSDFPLSKPSGVTVDEEKKILKTMSDVASKFAKLDPSNISKKSENVTKAATISERVSSLSQGGSFVTTAEKELRLKEIREAAVQKIEKKKILDAQLLSAMTTPLDEKKSEEAAVSTVVQDVQPEITVPEIAVPIAEIVVSNLDTLVPPPPRPTGSFSQNKSEIRSATQTRINEAYLRQLKGEEPLVENVRESKEPPMVNSTPVGGRREVPVESLGTGIFNALGDVIGGVVNLVNIVGDGVGKVTAVNPISQNSGSERMALGLREMFTGVKEIVKGGGNIVIGTVGIVAIPIVAAIQSIKSSNNSESKET
ncbi:hypothetical protein CCP3SC5AM1_120016 [Gammaproteobacteria bacterium]